MQTDSDIPGLAPDLAAAPAAPRTSRRIAWLIGAVLAACVIAALVWAARSVETSRALAGVERSIAGVSRPATVPVAAPTPAPPVIAEAPPSSDRLPPLPLGQAAQRAPDAVLRDLPDWLVAEVGGGGETSGASGDESAAPVEKPRRRVERPAAVPRADRYGSVFARCPGPGESGAVECRRAVCSGGARKAAACAPYRDQ